MRANTIRLVAAAMMLIGGIVLLAGVILAVRLSPSPALATLDPGESIVTDLSAEAGDFLLVVITVHDLAFGDRITTIIQTPYGVTSGSGGHFSQSTGTFIAQETGIYTIVIENVGSRAVTFDYRVTTTSSTEMILAAWGVPLVIIGFFILVGGLGLRRLGRRVGDYLGHLRAKD